MPIPRPEPPQASPSRIGLRLLATTDLHMHLTGYDYVNDQGGGRGGLARLAPLIAAARAEAEARGDLCLLLDNGDTLQGNAMGDYLADAAEMPRPHPMAACLNHLGFDAAGLGNHDFDHGIDYLRRAIADYRMPVVCSNISCPGLPQVRPWALLTRHLRDGGGQDRVLRIGILSAIPQQTADWSRHHLADRAEIASPAAALSAAIAAVRAEGADIVVVLAHMGIAGNESGPDAQNAAISVAALPGVDAVIAGHTHLRFPGPDHPRHPDVDADSGRLAGKPAVLPGFGGSDLGVIDLTLSRSGDSGPWQVVAGQARLIPVPDGAAQDDRIVALSASAHQATRRHLARPIGTLEEPMHSYFSLAQADPVSALLAAAKRRCVERAVRGTELAALPLLAAAATPATGGLEGPDNFIALPRGRIERRHIAGLSPFSNQVWAVRLTGAQVLDWLERSARLFNRLQPGAPDQLLADPTVPGYRFDVIHGLTYRIDPTAPPRFDAAGQPVPGQQGRIRDVTFDGRPLDPEQEFLVATTHYRVGGGGGYPVVPGAAIALRGETTLETALVRYLRAPDCKELRGAAPWQFAPALGVKAVLHTAPAALAHLAELEPFAPEPCGVTETGFARLRLTL